MPNLPLSPTPCLQRGLAGLQPASSSGRAQTLCSVNGRQCVREVNFLSLSLAIPQFKFLTQKSSLRLSSGHSGPVLTLSNAACSFLFSPHLLVADAGVWGTFLLGVAFRHVICAFYLLFPSQSGCPPRFKNFPQTHQCEGFLAFGKFLY